MEKTEEIDVVINEKVLETFGSNTLLGTVGSRGPQVKTVNLVFHETSSEWRSQHGGPRQWILNEYVMRCLINDVLWLRGQGIEVITIMQTTDPV